MHLDDEPLRQNNSRLRQNNRCENAHLPVRRREQKQQRWHCHVAEQKRQVLRIWHTQERYRGHRFPTAIIQVTAWMYARFTLSLREVEELLAERGLDISYYETVRRWFLKFGQVYARSIRHG